MDDIQAKVIAHAQADMSADPSMSHDKEVKGPSLFGRLIGKRNEWAAKQPSLSGQLAAMFREGIKDIRQTLNETYFGKGEHMPEAGTPGNPTQQQVTVEQGNFHGYDDIHGYYDRLDQSANRGDRDDEQGHTR